jgi:ParB family chromosome partitioning protein
MAKFKGLGRGLDALLSSVDTSDNTLQTIAIHQVQLGSFQVRTHINETNLQELADSIRAQGLIQPIVVREVGLGQYEIIAGERRFRAAKMVGLTDLPVLVRNVPDESVMVMGLIENIQRQELDAIEEAQGLQRLIEEFGLTHEKAASAIGRSRSAVTNLLRLLQLAEPVQRLLHDRKLDMGHARPLLALPALEQVQLAQQIVEQGYSVREVEQRVKQALAAPMPKPAKKPVDNDIQQLASRLSEKMGAPVNITHNAKGKGKLSITYSSLDDFERIVDLLNL